MHGAPGQQFLPGFLNSLRQSEVIKTKINVSFAVDRQPQNEINMPTVG